MTTRHGLVAALLVHSLLAADSDSAFADWPQFRGPAGQGVSDAIGLPVEWDEQRNIAWQAPVEGLAWSSPVVVGDRIYLSSAVEVADKVQELTAECRRLADGAIVWRKLLKRQEGDVEMHGKNSHASPSPLVEGDFMYVHFGPHLTACLRAADGQTVWSREFPYSPQHGTGGSPAIHRDLLILCCDGHDVQYVVGVDKHSGEERWRTPRSVSADKGFSFSTPLLIEVAGQPQAICPASGAVFAYDPADGKELWRCRYGEGYSVVPRPVFANGLLYVCTGYNRPQLLAIDPAGRGDVTDSHIRWKYDRSVPHNPSVVAVDGLLFFVSDKGVATCLDATTGEEHWQERLGGNFSASPLAAEGRVYFQDEAGVCHVVAARPEFKLLAKNTWAPGLRTYASFAVAGKSLLARSEDKLVRIAAQ
jgi:outer membrane protein assembly factor BamB